MSADYASSRHPDITGVQPLQGGGVVTTWRCLGCGIGRPLLGSRGIGVPQALCGVHRDGPPGAGARMNPHHVLRGVE